MALTNRTVIELVSRVHRFFYRMTNGGFGAKLAGFPMLLLTTTGRKSGRSRTTPLLYMDAGPNCVVIGSNGGADWHPAWWLNLQAHPDASIQIRDEILPVRAREAEGAERAELWGKVVAINPDFAVYEASTERRIPVVVLEHVANA